MLQCAAPAQNQDENPEVQDIEEARHEQVDTALSWIIFEIAIEECVSKHEKPTLDFVAATSVILPEEENRQPSLLLG
jgi:hypothetical protein